MISCQGGVKGKTSRGGYASSRSLVVKGCQRHSWIMSSGMQVLNQVNFDYMYMYIQGMRKVHVNKLSWGTLKTTKHLTVIISTVIQGKWE